MDSVLGILGMILWIVAVIALAAGITYAVIKLSPGEKPGSKGEQAPDAPS